MRGVAIGFHVGYWGVAKSRSGGAWIRGTWIDHASWMTPTLVGAVYPPVPDTQLFMNGSFVDSSIEGSVNVPGSGGGYQDGNFLHFEGTCSTWLAKRSRFARNSPDGTASEGGLMLFVPPAGSLKPTMRFEASEFVANKAGFAPPLSMQCSDRWTCGSSDASSGVSPCSLICVRS